MLQNIIVSFRSSLSKLGFSILQLSRRCVVVSKYVVLTTKHDLSYYKIGVSVIRLPREVADRFILNKISRVCFTKLSYFSNSRYREIIPDIGKWLIKTQMAFHSIAHTYLLMLLIPWLLMIRSSSVMVLLYLNRHIPVSAPEVLSNFYTIEHQRSWNNGMCSMFYDALRIEHCAAKKVMKYKNAQSRRYLQIFVTLCQLLVHIPIRKYRWV